MRSFVVFSALLFVLQSSQLFAQSTSQNDAQIDASRLFEIIDRAFDPVFWRQPFGSVVDAENNQSSNQRPAVGFLQVESEDYFDVITIRLTAEYFRQYLSSSIIEGDAGNGLALKIIKPQFKSQTLVSYYDEISQARDKGIQVSDLELITLARAAKEIGDPQLSERFLSFASKSLSIKAFESEVATQCYLNLKNSLKNHSYTRAKVVRELKVFLAKFPSCAEAEEAKQRITEIREHVPSASLDSEVDDLSLLSKDQQVDELIYQLRPSQFDIPKNKRRHRDDFEIESIHPALAKIPSPQDQLTTLGMVAFPKLLAYLQDSKNNGNALQADNDDELTNRNRIETSRILAAATLESIAGESFYASRGSFRIEKAIKWYEDNRSITENELLIRQVFNDGELSFERLKVFQQKYSDQVASLLIDSFPKCASLQIRLGIINQLAKYNKTPEVHSFLEQQLDSTQSILCLQFAAATALGRSDQAHCELAKENLMRMAEQKICKELDLVLALEYLSEHDQASTAIELIKSCVGCMKIHHFERVLTGLELILKPDTKTDQQVERLLIELLSNELEDPWLDFRIESLYIRNPRVCDYAMLALNRRFPERYDFSLQALKPVRDYERILAINAFRQEHGEDPLALPSPIPKLPTVDHKLCLRLLNEIESADSDNSLTEAIGRYRQLGPGAIQELDDRIRLMENGTKLKELLQVLKLDLCNTVSFVFLAKDEANQTVEFLDELEGLKSKIVEIEEFKSILTTLMLSAPKQCKSIALTLNRDRPDQGIMIQAELTKFDSNEKAKEPNGKWYLQASDRTSQFRTWSKVDFDRILHESELNFEPLKALQEVIERTKGDSFEIQIEITR